MSTIAFSKYFDIFTLVKCLEGYKSLVQVLAIIFLCLTMSLSLSFLVRSFLTLISRVTSLLDCYLDIKICGSAFNRGHLMGGKATFRAKKCKSTFYIRFTSGACFWKQCWSISELCSPLGGASFKYQDGSSFIWRIFTHVNHWQNLNILLFDQAVLF